MRVISGFLKSRRIHVPADARDIRPTTDKARETIFNIISNRFIIEGRTIADLYCGSGSFGIECISRGAEKVYFIDRKTEIVKRNAEELNISENLVIIKSGALEFLKTCTDKNIFMTFADPPYNYRNYDELVICASEYRNIFILEHSDNYTPAQKYDKYIILSKDTGITKFTFFNFEDYRNEEE